DTSLQYEDWAYNSWWHSAGGRDALFDFLSQAAMTGDLPVCFLLCQSVSIFPGRVWWRSFLRRGALSISS
ncbi:Hypothetical predicted protein, partial [Pelobates cultripes]